MEKDMETDMAASSDNLLSGGGGVKNKHWFEAYVRFHIL